MLISKTEFFTHSISFSDKKQTNVKDGKQTNESKTGDGDSDNGRFTPLHRLRLTEQTLTYVIKILKKKLLINSRLDKFESDFSVELYSV